MPTSSTALHGAKLRLEMFIGQGMRPVEAHEFLEGCLPIFVATAYADGHLRPWFLYQPNNPQNAHFTGRANFCVCFLHSAIWALLLDEHGCLSDSFIPNNINNPSKRVKRVNLRGNDEFWIVQSSQDGLVWALLLELRFPFGLAVAEGYFGDKH